MGFGGGMKKTTLLQRLSSLDPLDIYKEDEDRRIARVLLRLILFYIVATLCTMVLDLLSGGGSMALPLIFGCLLMLIPLFLMLRGHLSAGSYLTVIIIISAITVYATLGYGLRDYVIMAYPVAIILAGLVDQQRGLIISTLLTLLSLAWLVGGEQYGLFTIPTIFHPTWFDMLLVAFEVLLIAFEVNLLVTNLKTRLTQLRHELTERKQVETALRASQDVIRNINNNLVSGMIYQVLRKTDGTRKFTYLSDRVNILYGITPQEAMENPNLIYGRIHPDDRQRVVKEEEQANQALSVFRTEARMLNPDGSVRWSSFISNPKLLDDGSTCWDGIELDITERKRAEENRQYTNHQLSVQLTEIQKLQAKLHEQTLRDPLTNLYNRRYLGEALSHEASRAEREGKPFSLIMLDLDLFKHINDTYGHPVGDLFLVEIADLLRQHVRGMDTACRYGGEEFLLMLPGATSEDAYKRAEEIRVKCEAICILHEDRELRLTISLGIATFPIHGKEAENILIKADKAMYRSKRNGRNQTTIWSE